MASHTLAGVGSLTAGSAMLLCALALAPAARARTTVSKIQETIRRVENAVVDDDPGACALMAPGVQRELLQNGRGLARLPGAGCQQAVRRIHATYASYDELSSARQIVRQDLATLQTSPIVFAFGLRHATVTVIGFEAEPDGSDLRSTLTFGVRVAGRGWKVTALDERQQLVE
jgi:hypothetical protein